MTKRQREDMAAPPSWWSSVVEWICSKGGAVHSSIALSENRELLVSESVSASNVLMEIPSACLVSRKTVCSTDTGKLLADIIENPSCTFYNDRMDLLLAMYLGCDSDKKFDHYKDTLPQEASYDMLPRRWNESALQNLLSGSCLLDRVVRSRDGCMRDYEQIEREWNAKSFGKSVFPSFNAFSDMLVAVTSRSFAGMGRTCDEDIVMVCLLDLCKHHRGKLSKNVSYQQTPEGGVQVTASCDIAAGSALCITYGARGNAQLLFNYGFCIPNNIEPDGSSNDIFEFKAKQNLAPVDLRTGPKSYTFGPFVKVLELFHSASPRQGERVQEDEFGGGVATGDMEAFLNECDNEEDDGWDNDESDGLNDGDETEADSTNGALVALTAMQAAFERAKGRYALNKGHDIETFLAASEQTPRHFAAILIASELRAIYFYCLAIESVRVKLTQTEEPNQVEPSVGLEREDKERLKAQANELADAFMRIRYSVIL